MQHYIVMIMMMSFTLMPFMLVFHQDKRTIAINHRLFYYRHACILVFFQLFVCSFVTAMYA